MKEYFEVRKVSWDMLWHAVYLTANGIETWDRVTEEEALKISKKLIYNKHIS